MRYLRAALFLLLIGGALDAQDAPASDTLDWRGYFPLAVGNEWEYEHRSERDGTPDRPDGESRTTYLRFRIVGTEPGDVEERFTLVEERFAEEGALLARDTSVVRYDAESASVVTTGVGAEGNPYERPEPFFAADLDALGYGREGYWAGAWYIKQAEVEGWVPAFVREPLAPVVAKRFVVGGQGATAVHGFGFTGDSYSSESCFVCESARSIVTFAIVDGQTFGARAVGVEGTPEPVDPGALVVYPNPTSGRVTVDAGITSGRLEGGSLATVVDASGRLVHSVTVPSGGVRELDLGHLRSGLYLVRVGMRTGRVVVY